MAWVWSYTRDKIFCPCRTEFEHKVMGCRNEKKLPEGKYKALNKVFLHSEHRYWSPRWAEGGLEWVRKNFVLNRMTLVGPSSMADGTLKTLLYDYDRDHELYLAFHQHPEVIRKYLQEHRDTKRYTIKLPGAVVDEAQAVKWNIIMDTLASNDENYRTAVGPLLTSNAAKNLLRYKWPGRVTEKDVGKMPLPVREFFHYTWPFSRPKMIPIGTTGDEYLRFDNQLSAPAVYPANCCELPDSVFEAGIQSRKEECLDSLGMNPSCRDSSDPITRWSENVGGSCDHGHNDSEDFAAFSQRDIDTNAKEPPPGLDEMPAWGFVSASEQAERGRAIPHTFDHSATGASIGEQLSVSVEEKGEVSSSDEGVVIQSKPKGDSKPKTSHPGASRPKTPSVQPGNASRSQTVLTTQTSQTPSGSRANGTEDSPGTSNESISTRSKKRQPWTMDFNGASTSGSRH